MTPTRKAPPIKLSEDVAEDKPEPLQFNDGNSDHVYIREAASLIHRRQNTLRKWEQLGVLPAHLRSHRGERGWRYWTRDQIDGIKSWLRETRRFSGNALPHYNPTEKEVEEAIAAMRDVPRKKRSRVRDNGN